VLWCILCKGERLLLLDLQRALRFALAPRGAAICWQILQLDYSTCFVYLGLTCDLRRLASSLVLDIELSIFIFHVTFILIRSMTPASSACRPHIVRTQRLRLPNTILLCTLKLRYICNAKPTPPSTTLCYIIPSIFSHDPTH
jgi:hypothetical protein